MEIRRHVSALGLLFFGLFVILLGAEVLFDNHIAIKEVRFFSLVAFTVLVIGYLAFLFKKF